ncbi:hypothetical protein KKA33_02825 [Patescibacteria group bacterium]|nr:hypothetical protein [Patescibacteria group bacterium]
MKEVTESEDSYPHFHGISPFFPALASFIQKILKQACLSGRQVQDDVMDGMTLKDDDGIAPVYDYSCCCSFTRVFGTIN